MLNLHQLADKILVIGGSTYNQGTLSKLEDALATTKFLEEWAIIFANHKLFKLSNRQGDAFKITKELKDLNVTIIDKVGVFTVNKKHIYVLPDSSWIVNELEQIYTRFTEQKGIPVIEASNSGIAKEEDDDCLIQLTAIGDDGIYLPCINKIMTQVARSQVSKVAGLLLCGMGLDGADGLLEIRVRNGSTAVQMPSECMHFIRQDTDSIPNTAIGRAKQAGFSHELVSLEDSHDCLTLTSWLRKLIS